MEKLANAGRSFYGTGIAGLGIQQFIDAGFRPVIMAPSPSWIHETPVWAYLTGAFLIFSGALIAINKKIKPVWMLLGVLLFFFFLAFHVPYLLFINENSPRHLGLWTDPLKELALSGGALIMAGSFLDDNSENKANLIRLGSICFSIMLIAFGLDHFYYAGFVATLVPSWVPGHLFWTYFAGVALIGSGVAIILKIKLSLIAMLAGIMIFLWFIFLHIPRAIAAPYFTDKGNEVTSVFESLAFSGILFVIATKTKKD
ncbi:MAG: hypothetical protein JST87_03365 [Bacteroidetes bacterium]|nr:hypothetical protein [Bacteroidota bacterium]